MTRRTSMVGVALIALAATGAVSADGAAGAGGGSHSRSLTVVGGTAAQRELAYLTYHRVGGTTLTRVVFQSASVALRHEHVHGTEMVVVSRAPRTLRASWEQELYVGSYLGLMQRWPKASIAAAATANMEGPVARLRPLDVFGSNPKAKRVGQMVQRVLAASAVAKAHVVEVRIAVAPARALTVTLRVADTAAFLRHRTRPLLALLNRPLVPLLGYYLGVQDKSGRLVWGTYRLPAEGAVFVTPRLDSCSPVHHSELAGAHPPPCPAP